MNTRIVFLAALVIAAGCGSAVRQKTLFPAIQEHWTMLRADSAEPAVMDAAVLSGVNVAAAWAATRPGLLAEIERQVGDGTITVIHAASKRENVRIMDLMIERHGGL